MEQMVIWKYELPIQDVVELAMPEGAEVLSVANQNGNLCLWAMVEVTRSRMFKRTFEIVGTGNRIEHGNRKFIGTVVINPFVWHMFERV